jgi:cysteinyl-tRNA synthetase
MSKGQLHKDDARDVEAALRAVDQVLAILPLGDPVEELPTDIQALVRKRDEARQAKNFALADDIRRDLTARGYLVQDLPGGTRVSASSSLWRRDPSST